MNIWIFKITKTEILGIILALVGILIDYIFLRDEKIFYLLIGISVIIAIVPFFIQLILETGREKEKESKFLDFVRDLVEGVRSGIPISRSIINLRGKDYNSLSPHIEKMANQISIGIPLQEALETFAKDIGSRTITRAIILIKEADKTGGNIETILSSVAESSASIEKLKKERESAIYGLVVQGYIIYFIFIIIVLVMQFKILPMTMGISNLGSMGEIGISTTALTPDQLASPFMYLLITQGLFAGLIIGKLANGSIKAGVKHSIILIIISILVSTGARLFM